MAHHILKTHMWHPHLHHLHDRHLHPQEIIHHCEFARPAAGGYAALVMEHVSPLWAFEQVCWAELCL